MENKTAPFEAVLQLVRCFDGLLRIDRKFAETCLFVEEIPYLHSQIARGDRPELNYVSGRNKGYGAWNVREVNSVVRALKAD